MARLAPWVSRLLVIVIGYVAATISLRFVPVVETRADIAPPPAALEVQAVGSPSMEEIARDAARQNIFGKAGAKPVVAVKAEAPKTQRATLNLALIGVYAAQPADRALAIVSANGKPEEVFRIGETITANATLKEVLANEIVVDNSGRLEIYKLPEKIASTGRNTGLENLPGASMGNQVGQSFQNNGNGEPIDLPESPRAIRDTLARNPAMLNKLVSAVPYRENGRILGYRLTPKQGGGLLEANGILPGDVVTRVNGIALANQKNGIRALRKLVKANTVDLSILRDGVEIPISIPLE